MDKIYENFKNFLGIAPGTVVLTNLAFVLILVLIWKLTSRLSSANPGTGAIWNNRMIALIGGLCGWAIGTVFAPYSDDDLKAFRAIGTAASVFFSGYVVSKLDRFLEQALFRKEEGGKDGWERMGLFTVTFLLVAITVFINRFYAFKSGSPPGH